MSIDLGGASLTGKVDNLGQLVAPLIAAMACGLVARRNPRTRMAWGFLGASCLSWALGQAVWCYFDLVRRVVVPFPSLADVGFLAAVPLAVAGLLAFPSGHRRVTTRLGDLLDGLLVAGSLLFVSWDLVLGPIYGAHQGGVLKQALSMAYPASDILLVALVVVLAMHTERKARTGLRLVLLGIIAFAIADSSFAYFTEVNNYGIGGVLDTGWVAGYLLMALGALRAMSLPPNDPEHLELAALESDHVTTASILYPYALATLAGSVAAMRLLQGLRFDIFLLVEGASLLCVLGLRQILTLLDNVTLNRRLQRKVELGTRELRAREARFSALVENSTDPVTIIRPDGTIVYQSPSITHILGWDSSGSAGRSMFEFLHPDDSERWQMVIRRLVAGPERVVSVEWRARHLDGSWRTFQSTVTDLLDEDSVAGLVLNSRDVTDQRVLEDQLRHQALHDPLTGLANRALLIEHLDQAVRRRGRSGGSLALMFVDVHNFKAVNDLHGRARGDAVLRQVAERLQATLREADSVARLGGDHFAVLFEGPPRDAANHSPASRLMAAFREPFDAGDEKIPVHVCIGVANGDADVEDGEQLMRHANLAVTAAKSQGEAACVLYTPSLHESILGVMRIETELRRALERDELVLFYQPIVSLETGRATGVEALIRWIHPERGLVPPSEFIPIAESSGLIVDIGERVLSMACQCAQRWDAAGGEPMRMSVNVSPRQLADPGFEAAVHDALQSSGFDARRLTLEVTESLFVNDIDGKMELLGRLRQTGIKIAIDDFGTGYSSLSALRGMPVDILKIDKTFVDDIVESSDSARLVGMILQLASDFGMTTVGEGAEDARQVAALHTMGCQSIQGYYFSKPLPADQVEDVLRQTFAIPEAQVSVGVATLRHTRASTAGAAIS